MSRTCLPYGDDLLLPLRGYAVIRPFNSLFYFLDRSVAGSNAPGFPIVVAMLNHKLGPFKVPTKCQTGNTAKPFATNVERVPLLETDRTVGAGIRHNVQAGNDRWCSPLANHEI